MTNSVSGDALTALVENKFFVAGQMDAQGHAAEKFKIGSGGPVLALSKRLLQEAREALALIAAGRSAATTEPEQEYTVEFLELQRKVKTMRESSQERIRDDAWRWPHVKPNELESVIGAIGEISVVEAREALARIESESAPAPLPAPLVVEGIKLDDQFLGHLREAAYDWGIEPLEQEPVVARRAAIWFGRCIITLIDELQRLPNASPRTDSGGEIKP